MIIQIFFEQSMQRRKPGTTGAERDIWWGAEEGASRSCIETSSFLPRQLQMLQVHISREPVCYQVYGSVGGQAVHVLQEMCCKAANFREQLKSGLWRLEGGVCMPSSANARRQKVEKGREAGRRRLLTFQLRANGAYLYGR